MQRRCKYNNRRGGAFYGSTRDYIISTEQNKNQNQNGASPRRSRKKDSAENLLAVIVNYCDYEWLSRSNQ
jgi:hypothetical protein